MGIHAVPPGKQTRRGLVASTGADQDGGRTVIAGTEHAIAAIRAVGAAAASRTRRTKRTRGAAGPWAAVGAGCSIAAWRAVETCLPIDSCPHAMRPSCVASRNNTSSGDSEYACMHACMHTYTHTYTHNTTGPRGLSAQRAQL